MKANSLIAVKFLVCCLVPSISAQQREGEPAPMIYHNLVYHEQAKKVLLFGGNSRHGWGPDRSEVWQYDPNDQTWIELGNYDAISDSVVNAHSPAYDIESERVIVFNSIGETWAYNLAENLWKNMRPLLAPSPRCGQSMVYDEASDRMILFGGFGCTNIKDPILNDTWAYDYNTNSWEKMEPIESPPSRMYGTMVYDSDGANSLLWGGRLIEALDDSSLWAYSFEANTWTEIETEGGPDFIYAYPNMVFDPRSNDILLFGGGKLTEAFAGKQTNELLRFDLDNSKWQELSTTNTPPPVCLHSMVLLEDQNQVILFGGEVEEMYSDILLKGTWLLDLSTYTWKKR